MTTNIAEDEVARALRERDKERLRAAEAAAEALDPGQPCPVCGGALVPGALHPALAPFRARPAVRCGKCDFAAPLRPSPLGEGVALVVAVAVGWFGLSTVLDAQQLADGKERVMRFLIGGAFLCGGFMLGSYVRAAASSKQLGQRIAHLRRQRQDGPRKRPPPPWLADNLRELVFAAVLYLILRQFVVEAFVIPTGSMAPTLYGNNFRVTCPRCDYPFAVGRAEFEPAVGTATSDCPVCHATVPFDKAPTQSDGNKIIVNKLLYQLRRPERYEVFVFRYPERPWQSFIKRVVGLPGDRLRLVHGDLWADDELQPKPPHVQDAIWLPVFDGTYPWAGLGAHWGPADPATPAERVEVANDGSRFALKPAGADPVWMDYGRALRPAGVIDRTSYNRSSLWRELPVGDIRVRARVTPERGATVYLATVESTGAGPERSVVATFPAEGGAADEFTLTAGGVVLGRARGAPLRADAATDLAIAYADDRVRLIVGGETVLDVADPGAPTQALEFATARLGAAGAPARFEAVRVDRDIYYLANGGWHDPGTQEVVVPPHHYFAMGDNSSSSQDSRNWGFVHEGHVQGRAFLVWWPLLKPFDGRWVR